MENPNRPNQTVFKFKDSRGYWWMITVYKSGERQSLSEDMEPPDFEWAYTIEREGIKAYHHTITGLGDAPIRLKSILYDYLYYVTGAMMDGAQHDLWVDLHT